MWKKGTLTTWKTEKNFGFIQPVNTKEAEIFIHITGFRTGIERRPVPGDVVYYQVKRDETNGKFYAHDAHIRGLDYKESLTTWKKGTLTTWNSEKNFGFIQPMNPNEIEVFIHITGFRMGIERRPVPGDVVYYQIKHDETSGKLRAHDAHIRGTDYKEALITWKKGTLVDWKDDQGFGFIQPMNPKEVQVFIHVTGFRANIERRPVLGDVVYYQVIYDETRGKLRAQDAHIRGTDYQESTQLYLIEEIMAQSLILFPLAGSLYVLWVAKNPLPLIIYTVMSVVTLWLYYSDKQRAQRGAWRISEASLHWAELAGGWPGALIAQYNLRHKNAKFAYQVVFWFIVTFHELSWFAYVVWRSGVFSR